MIVQAAGLTRRFGSLVAVDQLDLQIPAGGVVGLVGPNGSGKSTLIRMLLGLIAPSEGSAEVLGHPISEPQLYADRVGALIESPAFIAGLSARANLNSLARLRGLPAGRVNEVIATVGLTGRDQEPVKRFSLGMKQRLGIAAALLPDPQVLILDEPTNGLDPAGIVEIRGLLQSLGAAGRTVIISSHLMSEIESICTHLVIIRFGVLLYAGPMADLLGQAQSHVDIRPEFDHDTDRLTDALGQAGWTVHRDVGGQLRVRAGANQSAQINRDASAAGFTLQSLTVSRDSLESIFLGLTGSPDPAMSSAQSSADGARSTGSGTVSKAGKQ